MGEELKWSIIIFAYNESSGIEDTIRKTIRVADQLCNGQWQIIVVDDGSTDGTYELAASFCNGHPALEIIRHRQNLGIGQALLSGYRKATGNNVCAIPADGQFDPSELLPFGEKPVDTIISFYRRKKTRYSLFRKFLSMGNRIYNRYFLGIRIRDVNWVKVYPKTVLEKIPAVINSSLVESEICAKVILHGMEIVEVPSLYHKRAGGKPKGASWKILVQALTEMPELYRSVTNYRRQLKREKQLQEVRRTDHE